MARLLVIDDEVHLLYSFELLLAGAGHEVVTSTDCQTATNLIADQYFDLVLVDILLKEGSGMQVLDFVQDKALNTPVVMITGQPSIESASDALRLGAFDYMVKPIDKATLLRIVDRGLRHKELQEAKAQLERDNERMRSYLEAMFQSVQEAIICVDPDMVITQANQGAEKICGYNPKEHEGQHFEEVFSCSHQKCASYLRDVLDSGQPVHQIRIECCAANPCSQVSILNASPLIDHHGAFMGSVLVIRDVSRLEAMQKSLMNRRRFSNIVGESPAMSMVYDFIDDLSETDTTVLICGETGTGKELVAEAIHFSSSRASGPLIKVNCSALSESLLESELFGHVRGAFTGAIKDRMGRFQMANGGTLFLDEIGELSVHIQLKLLRVLQDKLVERVGDTKSEAVDVRLISATNQNLKDMVQQGTFREDLFYRLKVVEINMPPLRDRQGDVQLLIEHFRMLFCTKFKKYIREVSAEARELLWQYHWPGNVRELKHAMEHACVRCHGGVITPEHLPPEVKALPEEETGQNRQLTKEDIRRAIQAAEGNKSKAATLLGISRPTLYRKIKHWQL